MIKVDDHEVSVNGNGIELMAELTTIIRSLYEHGLLTDERMGQIVRLAKMDKDELQEEAKERMHEFVTRTLNEDDTERGKAARLELLLRLFGA